MRSWFKLQDYEQNLVDGKAAFEREVHRLALSKVNSNKVAAHFKLKSADEMYAAVGRGDMTGGQLVSALHEMYLPKDEQSLPLVARRHGAGKKTAKGDDVRVRGVGNLLTSIANCCKPMPGDDIVGFITRGQGVTIHRQDCSNILNLEQDKRGRLIEAEWGGEATRTYPVSIRVEAIDRQGLLRDVSKLLADEKVDVVGLNTMSNRDEQTADMTINAEMSDLQQLSRVMDKLSQLSNVIHVSRSKV